ncbi:hypothetical protein [Leptonema illini]|uniref:hypothetical protein n=1 Tax=Leptonema illini TaxID=183 RepID=UPI000592CE9F|nr:hypothetical protein [Leptonema illini]
MGKRGQPYDDRFRRMAVDSHRQNQQRSGKRSWNLCQFFEGSFLWQQVESFINLIPPPTSKVDASKRAATVFGDDKIIKLPQRRQQRALPLSIANMNNKGKEQ